MSNTYRHRPAKFRPESERQDSRNYWRSRDDATALRALRRRERVVTRQTLRTATDWDNTVWPAWRSAAPWQLPSY